MRPVADNDFVVSKRTCGQVFVLPSRHLVHPAPNDNFVKLLYPLQNCAMHLKKIIFYCHHNFMKNVNSKLSKIEPENTL